MEYNLVYDYSYNHVTTVDEILQIRAMCNSSTLMCVGGSSIDSNDILRVVACSDCLSITTQTTLNQPVFSGSAYWYFTSGKSFGFSPDSLIIQIIADTHEQTSNQRLSWHLDGISGGWRLGDQIKLNFNAAFSKKVFLKYASK